jgi:hypothetical protein
MTVTEHRNDRLTWTALGVRMGFTRKQPQRDRILDAAYRMTWIDPRARPAYLDGPAVRAIVTAIFHHRRDQLRLVGIAPLADGRQLIGLEDTLGTRSYLLDLDSEAIYVLAEFTHPVTAPAAHVA